MRKINEIVLNAADTATGLLTGIQLDTNQIVSASFQASVSDSTAAGTLMVQVSNDVCPVGQPDQNFVVTNWVTLTAQNVAVTAGTLQGIILLPQTSYRWMRAAFNVTTLGTGTVRVQYFGLSV